MLGLLENVTYSTWIRDLLIIMDALVNLYMGITDLA